jgi:hypothetical protein
MMTFSQILPGTGRETIRRIAEGSRLLTQADGRAMAPSVGHHVAATAPRAGRIDA